MKKLVKIYKNHQEILNYLIVGVLTTIVSLLSYYLCVVTFLNPKNPLYLQIANIISWVCAVSFAYFTNRKYVFKSKEKNIFKEGIKFYCARLLTLLLDMLFMFILVSLLKMDDKIAKLAVQVIITIGNYIISRFVVFNNIERDYLNKFNIKGLITFILVFIFFSILFYCYPLVGDDWGKSSQNLFDAIKSGVILWKTFNGRFFGNVLVILMKHYFVFKVIIQALCITLILYFIRKIINKRSTICLLLTLILFFLMPVAMYRESISWMSGFANFVIPALMMLIVIYEFKKYYDDKDYKYRWYDYILVFMCGIFMNLFSEHTALFSVAFAIGLMILSILLKRKIKALHIVFLASTIIGCTLMFLSPVYRSIMPRTAGNIDYNNSTLLEKIINNLKKSNWLRHMFFDNIILNIFISFCYLYNIKKGNWISRILSIILFISMITFMPLLSFEKIIIYKKYQLVLSIFIVLINLLIIYILFNKEKQMLWNLLFYYLASFIVAIPLLAADGFGLRCFFSSYILQLLFGLTIYFKTVHSNKLFNILIIVASSLLCIFMLYSAIVINLTKIEREDIIKKAIKNNDQSILIPYYPYNFLLHQYGDARNLGYHQMVFKSYYGINQTVDLYFIPKNSNIKQ